MDLQGELHAAFAENVENRVPSLGQQLEAVVDRLRRDGREGIKPLPDARSGEAVDHGHAQFLRGPGGVLHVLGRPRVDTGRIAVAPDIGRQDGLVPLVDHVQHGLADEVIADRPDLKSVAFEHFALACAVIGLGGGEIDLEMIAPTGQFEAIVTETLELLGQFLQGKIGPLAREHRDRSRHEIAP